MERFELAADATSELEGMGVGAATGGVGTPTIVVIATEADPT
jgi:hypothetical protein